MFRPFYSNDLRMVRLTTLPDQLCKELGTQARDNLGGQMVVNTRVELCGAFVNNIDITLVNYTVSDNIEMRSKKSTDYLCYSIAILIF